MIVKCVEVLNVRMQCNIETVLAKLREMFSNDRKRCPNIYKLITRVGQGFMFLFLNCVIKNIRFAKQNRTI